MPEVRTRRHISKQKFPREWVSEGRKKEGREEGRKFLLNFTYVPGAIVSTKGKSLMERTKTLEFDIHLFIILSIYLRNIC